MASYIGVIHKDKASDFGISFPDFPGCISAGRTLDEARRMGAEALALHIEGMIAEGLPLPAPSTLDAVMADAVARAGAAVLIDVEDPADAPVRVNISVPARELAAIDAFAERAGLTRSGFLVRSARAAMVPGRSAGAKSKSPRFDVPSVEAGAAGRIASRFKRAGKAGKAHGKPTGRIRDRQPRRKA